MSRPPHMVARWTFFTIWTTENEQQRLRLVFLSYKSCLSALYYFLLARFSMPQNALLPKNIIAPIQLSASFRASVSDNLPSNMCCCFSSQETKNLQIPNSTPELTGALATALCLISIIKFYLRHRLQIHASDPNMMWKLVPFKGLIGVQAVQSIVLNAMNQANALPPTRTLSYNDLNVGLNSILTCFEAFLFMLFYIVPYFPRRSRLGTMPSKRKPFFAAIFHALNLLDVIRGIFTAIRLFQVTKSGRDVSIQQNGWTGNKIGPPQYGGPQQQEYNAQYRQ